MWNIFFSLPAERVRWHMLLLHFVNSVSPKFNSEPMWLSILLYNNTIHQVDKRLKTTPERIRNSKWGREKKNRGTMSKKSLNQRRRPGRPSFYSCRVLYSSSLCAFRYNTAWMYNTRVYALTFSSYWKHGLINGNTYYYTYDAIRRIQGLPIGY